MAEVRPLNVRFREVVPTDLPAVIALEHGSYPEDEAASKATLQYRQHQAAPYFFCALIDGSAEHDAANDSSGETLVGYICSTRCYSFTQESMTTHDAGGHLLAIHSVVVRDDFRRRGIASFMLKEYIKHVSNFNLQWEEEGRRGSPIEKIVLLAKANLLTFYVNAGFHVVRLSPIIHGSERWYELDMDLDIPGNYLCWVVDAFADPKKRGTGNSAAVVLMPDDTDPEDKETKAWMQTTANEFNLSETAFIWKKRFLAEAEEPSLLTSDDGNAWHFNIRFYTPTVEVPLCGHASLASASIVFQHDGIPPTDSIVFHADGDTLVGATLALPMCSHSPKLIRGHTRITLDFPSMPAKEVQSEEHNGTVLSMLEEAFSIQKVNVLWIGLSDIGDLLVELTPIAFQSIGYAGLNYDRLLATDIYSRGIILCCVSPVKTNGEETESSEVDFCSRFFAPKAGISEDPVTGSAHCVLAPYFCEKLKKATVIGHQQSERGGFVECTITTVRRNEGDDERRVAIIGWAVTTMSGKLQ